MSFGDIKRVTERLAADGCLAPRTQLHVYRTLSAMFRRAVRDELIDRNPCAQDRHELSKKTDRDPEWRAQAVFTRAAAEALKSCSEIPADRRVLYAVMFFTGAWPGEVIPLRWPVKTWPGFSLRRRTTRSRSA